MFSKHLLMHGGGGGKLIPEITVTCSNINVGETEIIVVNITDNTATGTFTLYVDDKYFTDSITNGKYTFNVTGLSYGTKTFLVKYSGDDKYLEYVVTGSFNVTKVQKTASFSPNNIPYPRDEAIKPSGPSDSDGIFILKLDTSSNNLVAFYYADILNGKGTIIIPSPNANNYKSYVTVINSSKYDFSWSGVRTFTVTKKDPIKS